MWLRLRAGLRLLRPSGHVLPAVRTPVPWRCQGALAPRPVRWLLPCTAARVFCAEAAPAIAAAAPEVPRPTPLQLRRLFVNSMVPFTVFGIVDQTVLIHAGDIIDNTLGVVLGMPTLVAAAIGQVFSDTCGVTSGGAIEAVCLKLGLPLPGLTDAQARLDVTKYASALGSFLGILVGCLLGMLNLLLIDLQASERAKKAEELKIVFETVTQDAINVTQCDRATLWIMDRSAGELWSHTAHGVEHTIRISAKEDASVVAWVAHNRTVANIKDAHQDPRWCGKEVVGGFRTQSILAAPVFNSDGKVLAVIQLLNKHWYDNEHGPLDGFDDSDLKAVEILSTHASLLLDLLAPSL